MSVRIEIPPAIQQVTLTGKRVSDDNSAILIELIVQDIGFTYATNGLEYLRVQYRHCYCKHQEVGLYD